MSIKSRTSMKRYKAVGRINTRPGHAPDQIWCVLGATAIDGVTPGSLAIGVGFAPNFLALAVELTPTRTLPVHVMVTGEAAQSNPDYARACAVFWRDRTDPHLENMAVVVLGLWPTFEEARAIIESLATLSYQGWAAQCRRIFADPARKEPPVPDDSFVRDMCEVFAREALFAMGGERLS